MKAQVSLSCICLKLDIYRWEVESWPIETIIRVRIVDRSSIICLRKYITADIHVHMVRSCASLWMNASFISHKPEGRE